MELVLNSADRTHTFMFMISEKTILVIKCDHFCIQSAEMYIVREHVFSCNGSGYSSHEGADIGDRGGKVLVTL